MNILLFILILLVLVLVHEFGHFFAAKKFNIRVDEFGFGFPPKLFGVKKGETEYTLNALPIGGFVKIFGENPNENESAEVGLPPTSTCGSPTSAVQDQDRNFSFRPAWQQAIVLVAGVVMNFLLAFVLFSFGFMSGLPTSVGNEPNGSNLSDIHTVILAVAPNSPAQISGLLPGDRISYLQSGKDILPDGQSNPDTIKKFILSHSNKEIEVGYFRGKPSGQPYVKLTPTLNKQSEPMIGISMDQVGIAKLSFFSALWEGMKLSILVFKNTVIGLFSLIRDSFLGKGSLESVTGPVGMVGIVGDAYRFGLVYLVSFMAFISINLSVINLLPFPALDGGRLFFLLIERIKGSKITPKIVNSLNVAGFAILILLMVVITYHDIAKLVLK